MYFYSLQHQIKAQV